MPGKIGSALVQYGGFRARGFDLVAIYDNDPKKVGREWNGLTVRDAAHLEKDLREKPADIAAVVTPAEAAQAQPVAEGFDEQLLGGVEGAHRQ